jgi:hypothetical protein
MPTPTVTTPSGAVMNVDRVNPSLDACASIVNASEVVSSMIEQRYHPHMWPSLKRLSHMKFNVADHSKYAMYTSCVGLTHVSEVQLLRNVVWLRAYSTIFGRRLKLPRSPYYPPSSNHFLRSGSCTLAIFDNVTDVDKFIKSKYGYITETPLVKASSEHVLGVLYDIVGELETGFGDVHALAVALAKEQEVNFIEDDKEDA